MAEADAVEVFRGGREARDLLRGQCAVQTSGVSEPTAAHRRTTADFSPGSPIEGYDYASSNLRQVLGFI